MLWNMPRRDANYQETDTQRLDGSFALNKEVGREHTVDENI